MPVKMQPTEEIKTHLGIEPNGRVQRFFTNTCYKRMNKFVPRKEGNLRLIVDVQADSITYESPYARYQYYGQREDGSHKVINYTTGGTGPYWDRRMWSAEKEQVLEEVQNYVERGGA